MRAGWRVFSIPLILGLLVTLSAWAGQTAVSGAGKVTAQGTGKVSFKGTGTVDVTLQPATPGGGRLVVGKKARRHEEADDALSAEQWRGLAQAPHEAVLYNNHTGNLLYVLPGGDRKIKVVVAPDWQAKGQGTLNSVRTVFKVGAQALGDKRRYAVVRGKIEE